MSPIVDPKGAIEAAASLVEKLNKALLDPSSGLLAPWQIRRTGKATAEALAALENAKIDAISRKLELKRQYEHGSSSDLDSQMLEKLALLDEEICKVQEFTNKAKIAERAKGFLESDATYQEEPTAGKAVDPDWLKAFFDKAKNISDEEMQSLFAKILAGEVATPGRFSPRTLHFVSGLTKDEAKFIHTACKYMIYAFDPHTKPYGSFENPPVYLVLGTKKKSIGSTQSLFEIDLLFHLDILAGDIKTLQKNDDTMLPLYRGAQAILLVSASAKPTFQGYGVTPLGRELLRISGMDGQTWQLAQELADEHKGRYEVKFSPIYFKEANGPMINFLNVMPISPAKAETP